MSAVKAPEASAEAPEDRPVGERTVPPASRSFWIALAVIALVALAVRFYFVLVGYDYYKVGGDAVYYHFQGWTIANGRWFVTPAQVSPSHAYAYIGNSPAEPSATHPPLYGLYLGFVSRLGFWSVTAHRLASCLLGTGTVVVIGLIGRKMAGERVGLIAALIAALYANLWINDGMLLSESMSGLTIALVLLAAYSLWRRRTWANATWLGLSLGVATLSRPEVLIVAPLLALPLVLSMRNIPMRRRVHMLGVVALGIIVLVGPWVGFNLSRFQKPVYLTDSTGSVLSSASCDSAYYGKYAGWYAPCYAFKSGPIPGDPSQRDAVVEHQAIQYMKDHLSRLPVVMAMRVGRLWDVFRPGQTLFLNSGLEGRTRGASHLAVTSYWLLMPFAIAGVIVLRRRRVPIMPILAPAIAVTAAAALTFGVVRYRVSAEPGIVLAAAVSLDVLWTSLCAHHDLRRTARTAPA